MGDGIDPGELLVQEGFSFHDRDCRTRTEVAHSKNRGSVGNDGHRVGLHGTGEGGFTTVPDPPADLCHTGGVDQAQIVPGSDTGLGVRFQDAVLFLVPAHRLIVGSGHGGVGFSAAKNPQLTLPDRDLSTHISIPCMASLIVSPGIREVRTAYLPDRLSRTRA